MSYTSQAINTQSMNGIISFDDGNGGLLENGKLSCVHMSSDMITSPTITDLDARVTTNTNNITAIDANVSLKADKTYVDAQLLLKDDITSVNSKLLLKADKTYTDSQLALKDNITSVNSKLLLKADKTYTDSQLLFKADKTYVDSQLLFKADKIYTDSQLLFKADKIYVDTQLLLKDNVTSVDSKCLILQDQIDDIISSEYYESIAVGTTTTLEEDQPATVVNSGTSINAVLDFAIPRGYRGYKGDTGDKGSKGDKGNTGSDGSNGSQGPPGDATAATISAGVAATAASAALAAAGASAASSTASAASAAASAASAALNGVKVQELEIKLNALDLEVNQLDTDVSNLKQKTQNITATSSITLINSELQTNHINSTSLYVADSINVANDVKASAFSGNLGTTALNGQNINIGTNEVLFNTIQIGSASTITTINGVVNYTNPFNNFFAQY